MNKFIISFLISIISINAVFVRRGLSDPNLAVYSQLEEIEETQMGKKLLDTISLQMKNKAPLSEIATMLQDLRQNLIQQQQEADKKFSIDNSESQNQISSYDRRIDYATNEMNGSQNEITALVSLKSNLENEIKNKQLQIDVLNSQEITLTTQRENNAKVYQERAIQNPKVIEVLEFLASKLSSTQTGAESETVVKELNRIGADNPILALVQLASTFPPEKLQSINQKISELKASMTQSNILFTEAETQAQNNFDSLKQEINEQREAITSAKFEFSQRLIQTTQQLNMQRKRKQESQKEIETANIGKTQKNEEWQLYKEQYDVDAQHRGEEINTVKMVEEILATKIEGASSYLQERIVA